MAETIPGDMADSGKTMEQTILEAAEKLFLGRGYAMTSTTMIAREAGCNQALVHYYFRTKENLFETIFKNKVTLFASRFFTVDDERLSFTDKLRKNIEAHFDIIAANPGLPFLLINEFTTNPERLASIKKNLGELPSGIYNRLDAEVRQAIAEGEIRPIATLDLILTVVSLNVFFFLMRPVVQQITGATDDQFGTIIAIRRSEVASTIINSLKP